MRLLVVIAMALGLWGAAGAASAQVTYNFQGGLYNSVTNAGACGVGECATYTTAQRAIASITFIAPLAPNLANADVTASISAYTFSDGVRTTTGPGPNAATLQVLATTNGAGVLTGYSITLQRTPGPPYPVSTPADPNSRASQITLYPIGSTADSNFVCATRGSGGSAVTGPGSCSAATLDAHYSTAQSTVPTTFAVSAPAAVPTLSEWAMILFGLLLAGGAVVMIQRRRLTA